MGNFNDSFYRWSRASHARVACCASSGSARWLQESFIEGEEAVRLSVHIFLTGSVNLFALLSFVLNRNEFVNKQLYQSTCDGEKYFQPSRLFWMMYFLRNDLLSFAPLQQKHLITSQIHYKRNLIDKDKSNRCWMLSRIGYILFFSLQIFQ
jgi:hypothetical protein